MSLCKYSKGRGDPDFLYLKSLDPIKKSRCKPPFLFFFSPLAYPPFPGDLFIIL